MSRRSEIPVGLLGPKRAWKATMRRRLRDAIRAVDNASLGCAYNPDYDTHNRISEAQALLREELASCSVKRWGR